MSGGEGHAPFRATRPPWVVREISREDPKTQTVIGTMRVNLEKRWIEKLLWLSESGVK